MLSNSLLDYVSDVLQRGRQLLELVVAESDIVGDVALVAGRVERLLELALGVFVLLLLVKDTALGDNSLSRVRRHLGDERLGVGHLFQLVLDVHLELQNFVSVVGVINLLGYLRGLLIHASLEEALSVVQFVLDHVLVELGELVVHVSRTAVVLDVEVAVGKQGKGGAVPWRKLKLVRQDTNHLNYNNRLQPALGEM